MAAGGGNVIALMPKIPLAPLVPKQHQLDEDDVDWASFEE